MTICIGMVCSDGIVMAGDTQESYATEKAFVNKIFSRDFPTCKVVVAGAGFGNLIDYVKDKIFDIPAALEISVELFQSNLCTLMDSLYKHELREFPLDREAERQVQLLVALQVNKNIPVLFSVDSTLVRRIPDVRVIGTETLTAVARSFHSMPLTVETGIYACLYIIAEAKRRYEGVGGETKIVVLGSADGSIRHELTLSSPQRDKIMERMQLVAHGLLIAVVPSVSEDFSKAFLKGLAEVMLETKKELSELDRHDRKFMKKIDQVSKRFDKRLAKSKAKTNAT
jgi:20S proteasome alpha/beta subunit